MHFQLIKAAFETAFAFLNTNGGIILIGVRNDGQIVGQDATDATPLRAINHSRYILKWSVLRLSI